MTKSFIKYKTRIRVITSLVVLFWIVLCGRLFSVQIFQGDKHRKKLIAVAHREESIPAERGNIFDRNNDALTRNIAHHTLIADPSKIINKKALARKLQKITGKSFEHYMSKLNSNRNFEYLERNLKNALFEKERIQSINGLKIKKHYRRAYPHGSIAAQILGYTDTDDKGISGIEKDYNKFLSGVSGQVTKSKGWQGKYQIKTGLPLRPAINGDNIKLTIDLQYQSILQEELNRRKKETNSTSAMGVIMNPQTGAILALASVPDYDNNYFSNYKIDNHYCHAITDQFEPGSTFKIVTAVAALAENKVSLSEEFNCENGMFTYFDSKIQDHEKYGQLTLSQIIKYSSNIGIIKIAERLGSKNLHRYARLFGFGSATNLSLNGETSGSLKSENNWSRISVGQISMGHEVGVSAIQLATAYAAIANDGYLVKPYIVEQIIQPNNKIRTQSNVQIHRKIANKNIMREIKKMLRQVVTGGTGQQAELQGWEIAGKTGTAQKYINGEYSNDKFISNFVGFFPVSNPQILSVIILDEPDSPLHWGGQGAAVAFKRVIKRIINMDDSITPPAKKKNTFMSLGYKPSKAQSKNIINQIPRQLSTVNVNNSIRVPDVRGKSLKRAIKIITSAGLEIRTEGSGQVQWQSPKAGTVLNHKDICVVHLQ